MSLIPGVIPTTTPLTTTEPDGLPHVGIEIRQDLIDSKEGAAEWAGYLYEGFRDVLADPDLYSPFDQQGAPT